MFALMLSSLMGKMVQKDYSSDQPALDDFNGLQLTEETEKLVSTAPIRHGLTYFQ
jgi:hypothetical protein